MKTWANCFPHCVIYVIYVAYLFLLLFRCRNLCISNTQYILTWAFKENQKKSKHEVSLFLSGLCVSLCVCFPLKIIQTEKLFSFSLFLFSLHKSTTTKGKKISKLIHAKQSPCCASWNLQPRS